MHFSEKMSADDVEWVVNSLAELGVKIGDRFFWLYKGQSLEYKTREEGEPQILWRPVYKREFGECCHPSKFQMNPDTPMPNPYTDGEGWQPLPCATASTT